MAHGVLLDGFEHADRRTSLEVLRTSTRVAETYHKYRKRFKSIVIAIAALPLYYYSPSHPLAVLTRGSTEVNK